MCKHFIELQSKHKSKKMRVILIFASQYRAEILQEIYVF